MEESKQGLSSETAGSTWKGLYRAGSAAALVAALLFRRNLDAEWLLLRMTGWIDAGPAGPPATILDWFTLLQEHQLLGLTLLNFFDLVNYALVGLIFMALLAALRRASPFWSLTAAALSLTGICVYFASNQAFTLLALSRQYAAATGDAQRMLLLAAGQAVLSVHNNASFAGSGIYLSFLLVTAAGLIISALMLPGRAFSKGTAYLGILANGFGAGYYLVLAIAPGYTFMPLSISALFLLAWYLRIGLRLRALGRQDSRRAASDGSYQGVQLEKYGSEP